MAAGHGRLCPACQPFDVSLACFRSIPSSDRRMHQMGTYGTLRSRASCALCQLVARAYAEGPSPQGPLEKGDGRYDALRVQGTWEQSSPEDAEYPTSCLVFYLVHENEEVKTRLVLRPLSYTRQLNFATPVNSPLLDYRLIQSWIKRCQTTHPLHTSTTGAYAGPRGFRLINVQSWTVEGVPGEYRYLALSYVWGSGVKFQAARQNVRLLSTPGGLKAFRDQLSPTIRDAIVLTQQLNEKYLWVDSLCIVQDDPESLMAIEDMDLIYSQAWLVICAAGDRCSIDGLPGINSQRQPSQWSSPIFADLTLAAQFDVSSYMDYSIYSTRGWTYQEDQFAQRALIFVNQQVYFRCPTHIYTEDVVSDDSASADRILQGPASLRRYLGQQRSIPLLYFQAVEAYTSRTLTYPSDILKAFTAVLNLQRQSMGATSYTGLPTAIFDMALLWQPTGKTKRRPGFPSWSWAGWTGSVHWRGDTMELISYSVDPDDGLVKKMITDWLRDHTYINWKTASGEMIWNPEQLSPSTKDKKVPQESVSRSEIHHATAAISSDDGVGYNRILSTLDNPYGRSQEQIGIYAEYPRDPAPPPMHPCTADAANQLHISALVIPLRITPSHSYLRYASIDPVWEARGREIFLLLNRLSQICGYVLLDDSWTTEGKWTPEAEFDFVVLSDANYFCNWGRPHEAHPYTKTWDDPAYIERHVMMIGEGGGGGWERLGLGRAHEEALKDGCGRGARWKDIILV